MNNESKLLILSPGHGGKDPGAIDKVFGLQEKKFAWDFVWELKGKLERTFYCEARVVQPSMQNPNVDFLGDLRGAINTANDIHKKEKVSYYMAIHANAGGGQGFESFTYTKPSTEAERIRKIVHEHVAGFLKAQYGTVDRGMKHGNLAEVRDTLMPAGLYENLFIDNAKEAKLLASPEFRKALANEYAYALGLALELKRR
jgi:N-acetylmuramoyl-L-alanine amidase